MQSVSTFAGFVTIVAAASISSLSLVSVLV